MEPFKNLFNPTIAEKISIAIKRNYSQFNTKAFLHEIGTALEALELKERVSYISNRLYSFLPQDPQISIPLLVKALKQNSDDSIGIDGFAIWPFTHFISVYGLKEFDLSMSALKEMTKLFTSEFAVRIFFIQDQKRTLKYFKIWQSDESEHVRRLVSEGSRPLLPWGQKLHSFVENPELTWSLLEKLKNDPSEYVRKSVANHINDHSKNHPDYVIDKLLKWHFSKSITPELTWVIKHASRSLIKKGYKKAFILHGVEDSKIKVIDQKIINKKIKLGESLNVLVSLKNLSKKSAAIILDHEIHFLKSNNKHSVKVFKGRKISLNSGEIIHVKMSIPIKFVTTRVYYPGEQFWNIKINGIGQIPQSFSLKLK